LHCKYKKLNRHCYPYCHPDILPPAIDFSTRMDENLHYNRPASRMASPPASMPASCPASCPASRSALSTLALHHTRPTPCAAPHSPYSALAHLHHACPALALHHARCAPCTTPLHHTRQYSQSNASFTGHPHLLPHTSSGMAPTQLSRCTCDRSSQWTASLQLSGINHRTHHPHQTQTSSIEHSQYSA
jgi:hypothetical protein